MHILHSSNLLVKFIRCFNLPHTVESDAETDDTQTYVCDATMINRHAQTPAKKEGVSAFTAQLPKITPTNQSDEQREAHDNLSISKIRLCKRKPDCEWRK